MANWPYIAVQIAKARHDDFRVSEALINIAAVTVLFFPIEDHAPDDMKNRKFKLLYNCIMTLANRKGLVEHEKVKKLHEFLGVLYTSKEYIDDVLVKGGYSSANATLEAFKKRDFHPEIIKHCENFFKQGHYFVAVNEACKAYNNAVKKKLKTSKDGTSLMLGELGSDKRLRCVPGTSASEQNLLEGVKYLSAGLIQGFRNPTSHETAYTWQVDEKDCLDILSIASYLFRQLDKSTIKV